jgi:hypothetical protein
MGLKGYRLWVMGQLDSTCSAPPRAELRRVHHAHLGEIRLRQHAPHEQVVLLRGLLRVRHRRLGALRSREVKVPAVVAAIGERGRRERKNRKRARKKVSDGFLVFFCVAACEWNVFRLFCNQDDGGSRCPPRSREGGRSACVPR